MRVLHVRVDRDPERSVICSALGFDCRRGRACVDLIAQLNVLPRQAVSWYRKGIGHNDCSRDGQRRAETRRSWVKQCTITTESQN